MTRSNTRIVVLTGGIGGAKLVLGLARRPDAPRLTAIVNTGDDFTHLGLPVCPDLDTLMYTLADEVNPQSGWGRRDETWTFMDAIGQLGGDTWFRIGDRDLATHVRRAQLLADGKTLTAATQALCTRLGVRERLLPMTDTPAPTRVITDQGRLAFQHYFVRDRAEPIVRGLEFADAQNTVPTAEIRAALREPGLAAIIVAPSNPYLSIDPILAVPGLREALRAATVPVVAVSPIVAGAAIKGPAAKIMQELGIEPSAASVAAHYRELIDGFIVDEQDRNMVRKIEKLDLPVRICDTIMQSVDDKIRLAGETLAFAASLSPKRTENTGAR